MEWLAWWLVFFVHKEIKRVCGKDVSKGFDCIMLLCSLVQKLHCLQTDTRYVGLAAFNLSDLHFPIVLTHISQTDGSSQLLLLH